MRSFYAGWEIIKCKDEVLRPEATHTHEDGTVHKEHSRVILVAKKTRMLNVSSTNK